MSEDGNERASPPPTGPRTVPRPSQVLRLDSEALAPVFFGVLFVGTGAALLYTLSTFIGDAVVAFVLAGMFRSTFEGLRRRLGGRAFLASGVVTMLVLVLIVTPLLALGSVLVADATRAYAHLSELTGAPGATSLEGLVQRGQRLGLSRPQVLELLQLASTKLEEVTVEHAGALASDVLDVLLHLTTSLVVFFYVLVDGERLRRWVYQLSPLPDAHDALVEQTFKNVSRGVIYGSGLGSAMQGVLGAGAMWACGLPSPVLWGAVMSVLAFLPLVGITVVTVPATVLLALDGRTGVAVAFFTFCTVQGIFIENVVKTRLMGSAMRMHDVLVFLSVLGGIGMFGLIGLVYGPLCAMLFITLADLYFQHYRPQMALRLARAAER